MKITSIILSVWQTICVQMGSHPTIIWPQYSQIWQQTESKGAILINSPEKNNDITQPARDGNLAIIEEFVYLERQNTIEAMELFIARHPDHPLVEKAQQVIRRLEAGKLK